MLWFLHQACGMRHAVMVMILFGDYHSHIIMHRKMLFIFVFIIFFSLLLSANNLNSFARYCCVGCLGCLMYLLCIDMHRVRLACLRFISVICCQPITLNQAGCNKGQKPIKLKSFLRLFAQCHLHHVFCHHHCINLYTSCISFTGLQ